jgi:hypothetical protein
VLCFISESVLSSLTAAFFSLLNGRRSVFAEVSPEMSRTPTAHRASRPASLLENELKRAHAKKPIIISISAGHTGIGSMDPRMNSQGYKSHAGLRWETSLSRLPNMTLFLFPANMAVRFCKITLMVSTSGVWILA